MSHVTRDNTKASFGNKSILDFGLGLKRTAMVGSAVGRNAMMTQNKKIAEIIAKKNMGTWLVR